MDTGAKAMTDELRRRRRSQDLHADPQQAWQAEKAELQQQIDGERARVEDLRQEVERIDTALKESLSHNDYSANKLRESMAGQIEYTNGTSRGLYDTARLIIDRLLRERKTALDEATTQAALLS